MYTKADATENITDGKMPKPWINASSGQIIIYGQHMIEVTV